MKAVGLMNKDFWNKRCVIYFILNRINGKGYVGQTRQKLRQRMKDHKSGSESYVDYVIKKYGWENFSVFVLEECASPEELNEREMYWIKTLHTKAPYGYNLTDGGDGSTGNGTKRAVRCIDTGEIFESITSAADKFNVTSSNIVKVCQNKTIRAKGMKFEYVDAPLSEEAKSRKPNYFSEPVRCLNTGEIFPSMKVAAEHFGMTDGSVSAVCTARCLSINGLKFEYMDEEKRAAAEIKRQKLSPIKKPVICTDTGTVYECAVAASKATGIYRRSISFACAGKHATAGGLHWEFVKREED